jgi:DNA-binding transcriptional regulator YdaS (Cro superfamily)
MGRKPKIEIHKIKALSNYLNGKSHTEFARSVNISCTHLSSCLTGRSKPSLDLSVRISKVTDGAVTFKDLRPDVYKEVMKHAEVEK